MKIVGLDGMTSEQLQQELAQGARFVIFEYCISVFILTFKRPSSIYYIQPGANSIGKSWPFILMSLFAGWWGIPWGPIWTIASLITNLGGGRDVTPEVVSALSQPA